MNMSSLINCFSGKNVIIFCFPCFLILKKHLELYFGLNYLHNVTQAYISCTLLKYIEL